VCGRPREESEKNPPPNGTSKGPKPPKSTLIAASTAALVVVGGVFIWQLPNIPVLCDTVGNCAVDKENQKLYETAVSEADSAVNAANQATQVSELQQARDRLQGAIEQLRSVSPESKQVYLQAQDALTDYEGQLTSMDERLQKEQVAQQKLNQATNQANSAQQQSSQASTLEEFEAAQAKWQEATKALKEIPDNTFVTAQKEQKLPQYQKKVTELEDKIEQKVAAQRQRRNSFQNYHRGDIEQKVDDVPRQRNYHRGDRTQPRGTPPPPDPKSPADPCNPVWGDPAPGCSSSQSGSSSEPVW
jgi:hypothetical protein